jgi:hypothetical protein
LQAKKSDFVVVKIDATELTDLSHYIGYKIVYEDSKKYLVWDNPNPAIIKTQKLLVGTKSVHKRFLRDETNFEIMKHKFKQDKQKRMKK